MNQDELKTWLQENLNSDVERDFFRDNFSCDEEYYEEDSEEEKSIFFFSAKEKGITWVSEDSYGGEGQGDDFWNVVRFSAGDSVAYVQFDGWYQSYNGSEYTEWFFVEPKEVTVTQYFKVK